MSEPADRTNAIALPSRKGRQSLNGYVREHQQEIENTLFSGVPYQTLVGATLAAGFSSATLRSIESAMYRARRKGLARPAHPVPQPIVLAARTAIPREAYPQPPLDTDLTAQIGRRFRQLVRTPRPGSDEPDPLI